MYAVACNRLHDEPEAEEVVQDVFYSLWKRRDDLEIKHSLNTYLSVAVKYQVINRQSRKFNNSTDIEEHLAEVEKLGVDSTDLWFSEKELKQQLEACIDKLPKKCQIVFKMSREEGMSNAQIAKELGVTEKAVEANVTRALKNLKSSLHISIPLILSLLDDKHKLF
ncbi:RNA polymerase sigma factor [compost metagenome]